ncbi:5-oxoprolinase subunit PxpB [Thalassotalea atypica]|uniref:5-oxoprolinase subunit PxpB n=1 Tax=Thalassotalea atypica TaxID=2054316 RepID=UPI0025746B29|nr:5-oxoprolinase subunit PxpB [Thalassotalea atypica]
MPFVILYFYIQAAEFMSQSTLNLSNYISTEIAGESALILYLTMAEYEGGNTSELIAALAKKLAAHLSSVITEVVPSYQSMLISFDLFKVDHLSLSRRIHALAAEVTLFDVDSAKEVTLPVYYHSSVGADLSRIAQQAKISIEDVIKIHQRPTYTVQAIGFAPGFSYLGDVDPKIITPRLNTPRTKVPKGAVAIANNQTAIYPQVSPGGWNIIGLCPTTLFDPNTEQPSLLSVGDKVKFLAIDKQQFIELGGKLDEYMVEDN